MRLNSRCARHPNREGENGERSTKEDLPSTISWLTAKPVAGALRMPQHECPVATYAPSTPDTAPATGSATEIGTWKPCQTTYCYCVSSPMTGRPSGEQGRSAQQIQSPQWHNQILVAWSRLMRVLRHACSCTTGAPPSSDETNFIESASFETASERTSTCSSSTG